EARLAARGLSAEIALTEWPSLGNVQGAAISLIAVHAQGAPATFVGLGERGKPAETVADEVVDELLAFLDAAPGAVDPHSADQIPPPPPWAPGGSKYTATAVTEHLRTNATTIRTFLDRDIHLETPGDDRPGRVVVDT